MNRAPTADDSRPAAGTRPERGIEIEARDLTRRFGERVALDALSLRIAPGESFALLGANGAGKTTFIRLVTGALLPSAGELRVDGISPALKPDEVHARLGFVMETSRLYPELRVQGFLRFMGGARGLAGEQYVVAPVADSLWLGARWTLAWRHIWNERQLSALSPTQDAVSLRVRRAFGPVTLRAWGRWVESDYPTGRDDDAHEFGAGIGWQVLRNWELVVDASRQENESNRDVFSYRSTRVSGSTISFAPIQRKHIVPTRCPAVSSQFGRPGSRAATTMVTPPSASGTAPCAFT